MRPKMIIFDAGRTLLDYREINILKGKEALMPYITKNPKKLNAKDLEEYDKELFEFVNENHAKGFESQARLTLKLLYEMHGIEFSIPIEEVERIEWNEEAIIETIPHATELLEQLNHLGIRTAVISNIDFSASLLKERLDLLYPNNQFEFVIGSSDYGVRKPTKYIFDLGISKSGLKAEDIWYVGDKVPVDVEGSRAAGMTPVLYMNERNTYDEIPKDTLVIDDLIKLLDYILKNMKFC